MPDEPTRADLRPGAEAPDAAQDPFRRGGERVADPDEISLRDLYLIFRRGLPLVLGVALLAALAAFAWVALRPDVFEAEATVTSTPPSVRMRQDASLIVVPEGDGAPSALALDTPRGHTGATYRTIAEGRSVFDATIDRLVSDGTPAPMREELEAAAELEVAAEGQTPLIVAHRVRWDDAQLAATYANAWAQTTVEQARDALLADVEQMLDVTLAVRDERLAQVQALESSLAALDAEGAQQPERARIERDLALANRAHAAVAELVPLMGYMAQLVPGGTRILDPAAPPSEPAGPGAATVAGLALVLAALAGIVFVFLREAVREPPSVPGRATRSPGDGHRPPTDAAAASGSPHGHRGPPR